MTSFVLLTGLSSDAPGYKTICAIKLLNTLGGYGLCSRETVCCLSGGWLQTERTAPDISPSGTPPTYRAYRFLRPKATSSTTLCPRTVEPRPSTWFYNRELTQSWPNLCCHDMKSPIFGQKYKTSTISVEQICGTTRYFGRTELQKKKLRDKNSPKKHND